MVEGVRISRRLVAVNATGSALRSVLSLTVLLWVQSHLIRRIPAEEYALYPVLMAVMVLVSVLSSLLVAGLGRYVTEAYARRDTEEACAFVSTAFPVLSAVAVLLAAGGWLVAAHVDAVLAVAPRWRADASAMLGILVTTAALQVAAAPLSLGFTVHQRFVLRNAIGLGSELLRIGLLFALLLGISTRVLWVVVAAGISQVIELVVVCWISRRLTPALRPRLDGFRRELLGTLLSYGGWAVLSRLAAMIRESSDPIVLNRLATATDVSARYLGAVIDVNYRRTLFGMTNTALPALTAMHATGQDDRLRRSYLTMSKVMLWLLMAAAVPMLVFRREFFALYLANKAGELGDAAVVMALFAARAAFLFPNAPLGLVAVAKGRVRGQAAMSLLIELINLGLTLYLVGVAGMGAVGAALSTFTVTALLYPPLFWRLGLLLTDTPVGVWLRQSVLPGFVPTLVAGPVWASVCYARPPRDWWTLAAELAIGGAVYGLALLLLGLAPDERARLRALLRGRSNGAEDRT